jgi:hypothetical protein
MQDLRQLDQGRGAAVLISDELHDDMVLSDGTVLRLGGAELAALRELRAALAIHRETAEPFAIERGLVAARLLLAGLPTPEGVVGRRPHLDELRRLADSLPEFGALLTAAADAAGRAVAAGYGRLWAAIGLRGPVPCWDGAEHEAARMVFACACGSAPEQTAGGEWLQAGLRRIAATRLAELICGELADHEAVWQVALGDRYDSLRHRCAPRTARRSRGLAEMLAGDPECCRAVARRLERWVSAGGHPHELGAELEAAVVHARTPSRLA